MKKINLLITGLFCLQLILLPGDAIASDLTVRPFLIDRNAGPRDIIEETIVLSNDTEKLRYIYATVNEISVDNEGVIKEFVSPVMTDRTSTITSWIEVTRGRIELSPGERREVPLTVRINPFVEPGEYHAFIGFGHAKNRPTAESNALAGEVDGVILKINIGDNRTEGMKVSGFSIDRFITNDNQRVVDVLIENTGEMADVPVGEIIFYDSRGSEISSVDFNTERIDIAPGEEKTISALIPIDEEIGRFKANLSLNYGVNQKASLFDSTSFYLMPINLLMLIFGFILLGTIMVTLLFRRVFSAEALSDEDGDSVVMYVKDGHEAKPKEHDINLKNID